MSSGSRFSDIDPNNKRLPAISGYLSVQLLPIEKAVEPLLGIIPFIDVHAKTAKKHCSIDSKYGLTRDESASIYLYTMETGEGQDNFYALLNAALREESRLLLKPFFSYLRLIDAATTKLPSIKTVVWRGVSRDLSASFKEKQVITWWTVSSCTVKVDIIKGFIGTSPNSTLFLIECQNGKDVSEYTCFPNEHEVLLMPGTQLQVFSNSFDHQGGLHVIHLKEISDDEDVVKSSEKLSKTINYPDGTKYTGQINDKGEPDGQGTIWINEDKFKGDRRHGRGICNYSNGNKYNGEWLNGAKEGRGKFIWGKDGTQWYEGDYRNDNMNGHGTMCYSNGQKYDGEFRDGQLHGQGTVMDSNGRIVRKGRWENSKPV
ncbi:unnamed protein product [Adineta steineri]|uniref:NAD(P)(+)--arginine ADP-ribosyltransferase n=1 Tax=Adineta steineri TaxID=433720 RepID=A0A813Z076_9BILA|nr:unnamed protein product [Adineta steineri]CAF0928343.1 unnamed protein product [Adineta steineri]CAF0942690.1 unnamed protein product [Adineta steineri]CAF3672518.1 unnamed protein product [Adineta steineri]CAF3838205.1 unnamed protein product [Adineta steineri]